MLNPVTVDWNGTDDTPPGLSDECRESNKLYMGFVYAAAMLSEPLLLAVPSVLRRLSFSA